MKQLLLTIILVISVMQLSAQNETYYFSKTVDVSIDDATISAKAALKKQGFGIVSESDMDKTLSEKLGVSDMKPYRVLGACNAKIAFKVLQVEENVAIFLPCKVILKYKEDHKTEVVIVNPEVAMKAINNKEAKKIFKEVSDLLKTALAGIVVRSISL